MVTVQWHNVIIAFWKAGFVPQSRKDPTIVMIYKKKQRSKADVCIQQEISLMCPSRATTDFCSPTHPTRNPMWFPKRQKHHRYDFCGLPANGENQRTTSTLVFVDLFKAFDTVNRWMLWHIMGTCGCPPKFMDIIRSFLMSCLCRWPSFGLFWGNGVG